MKGKGRDDSLAVAQWAKRRSQVTRSPGGSARSSDGHRRIVPVPAEQRRLVKPAPSGTRSGPNRLVCRTSDPAGAAGAGEGRGLAPRPARAARSHAAPGSDRHRQSGSGRRESPWRGCTPRVLRPQSGIIGRNLFCPARGFVSSRRPGGENPGGHEPSLPDSARTGESCPTESTAWGNVTMAADTCFGDADDPAPPGRRVVGRNRPLGFCNQALPVASVSASGRRRLNFLAVTITPGRGDDGFFPRGACFGL